MAPTEQGKDDLLDLMFFNAMTDAERAAIYLKQPSKKLPYRLRLRVSLRLVVWRVKWLIAYVMWRISKWLP